MPDVKVTLTRNLTFVQLEGKSVKREKKEYPDSSNLFVCKEILGDLTDCIKGSRLLLIDLSVHNGRSTCCHDTR